MATRSQAVVDHVDIERLKLRMSKNTSHRNAADRFDTKGVPATRRGRIEAAVEAGGKHVASLYEAWIAADPRRGDVRVLLTGPYGFERTVRFAADEEPAVITERVRATLDE